MLPSISSFLSFFAKFEIGYDNNGDGNNDSDNNRDSVTHFGPFDFSHVAWKLKVAQNCMECKEKTSSPIWVWGGAGLLTTAKTKTMGSSAA